MFLSLRTEPQGPLSRPLPPCCIQPEWGLSSEGFWQEGLFQPAGALCDKPGDIPGTPWCSLQLMKKRSRAEDYMEQSLPYLRDPQSSVRLAAVRFLGESQSLALFGPAWPCPCTLHWQLWLPQPPRGKPQPPSAPCHMLGLVVTLPSCTPHVAAGGPWASHVEGEGGRAKVTLLGAHWELGLMELCAQGAPRGT